MPNFLKACIWDAFSHSSNTVPGFLKDFQVLAALFSLGSLRFLVSACFIISSGITEIFPVFFA
jgi:hypothetical protein